MDKKKLNIMVLFGGRSAEHEISILSARSVINALTTDRFNVIPVGITRQGSWVINEKASEALEAGLVKEQSDNVVIRPGLKNRSFAVLKDDGSIEELYVDAVFPVLHGTFGEDGTIQGLFEMADIPYVGDGVLASAVGMDKSVIKNIWHDNGLPVLAGFTVMRSELEADSAEYARRALEAVGVPCFVKPPNAGSSVGITKVSEAEKLEEAMLFAAKFDRKVLVEAACKNPREIEIGVIGNDDPQCAVPGEISYTSKFYDYQTKYQGEGDVQLTIPAPISDELKAKVADLACRAWKAADLNGLGRIDFLLDCEGQLWLNEVNTLPGFTQFSMFTKLWEAAGVDYKTLTERLVDLAFARYADKDRNLVEP